MKTEKIIVSRDQSKIDELTGKIETGRQFLSEMVRSFNSLNLRAFTTQDINIAVNQPERFVKSVMESLMPEPELVKVGNLEVKKKTTQVDQLDLPDFSGFYQSAQRAHQQLKSVGTHYFLVDGDTVQISEDAWQKTVDGFTLYATTEKEKRIYKEQRAVGEAFNKLNKTLIDCKYGALFDELTFARFFPKMILDADKDGLRPGKAFFQRIQTFLKEQAT